MRKIVVDGEQWRWCIVRDDGWGTDYTPTGFEASLYLRGPGGSLEIHNLDDVTTDTAISPGHIATYIRRDRRNP